MGEKTAGLANRGDYYRVNNKLSMFISTARHVNYKTNTNWENKGVIPDIESGYHESVALAHNLAKQAGEAEFKIKLQSKVRDLETIHSVLALAKKLITENKDTEAQNIIDKNLEHLVEKKQLDEIEINDLPTGIYMNALTLIWPNSFSLLIKEPTRIHIMSMGGWLIVMPNLARRN